MSIITASASNTIQGTGINTPPATLVDTLNSITSKAVLPVLGDNVFLPSPVFWAFSKKGRKFGGGELVYALATQEEMTGGAFYGPQLLNVATIDSIQPADQVWKHYYQTVAIPVTDVILNRGGTSALDIVKTKFQMASASMLQKLARALWHTAPQNTSLDIDDIDSWVGSTTNTIAGINRSTASNAFWKPAANQAWNGTSLTVAETGYQAVVYAYAEPDLMIMTNTSYAAFKAAFFTNVRFTNDFVNDEAIQGGIRYHFLFNNATVVPDRNSIATSSYLLNTDYIYPIFHEADYFNVDPFIKPSNQRVVVSAMYLTWQVICPSPRMNIKFTGLSQ